MNYEKLIETCQHFAKFANIYGLPKTHPKNQKFSGLIKTITGQLLSTSAAATIYNRTIDTIGGENANDWLKVDFETLRSCGLSKAKVDTLTTLANDIQNNKLDLDWLVKQDSSSIYHTLIQYKGIGDWTAKGYPLMQLQKEDFFLSEDLGVRDGVQVVMNLNNRPTPANCEKIYNDRWQPYGGSASRLLWYYKDCEKSKTIKNFIYYKK